MSGTAQLGASLSSIGDGQNSQIEAMLKIKGKAKSAAGEFESMFLNSMFEQMNTNVDGEGPFGGSGAQKVWRSFLTNQYAQMYAKAGGVGIANHVYDELLKLQGVNPS
ncbi:MAG: rod-binding protein [Xanthobacteraceae bacterium]